MIGAAALLVLVAVVTRPRANSAAPEGEKDQLLFPDWKDPAAAKSLEISSVDDTTGKLHDFKVAETNGKWVIPSHSNYPANAEQNVVNVASSLINLKILGVVSDSQGEQETYGVVEPNIKLAPGAAGVGKLVVVQDGGGQDLARLIVGKEDKGGSADSPSNLRFVRKAGQDRIYRVALATDMFSTKFQEWIDPDLLNLKKQWDINRLKLRDYTMAGSLVRKWDLDLAFDVDKSVWTVKQLTDYKDNHPVPGKLGPNEELDSAKLNELKMDASGLKIGDVERKPDALIAKLKAGKDYLSDPTCQQALEEAGFMPFPEKKPDDLLAYGGDMTIGMKDGVEYAVHFGAPSMTLKSGDEKEKKPGAAANKKSASNTNTWRTVFVTARFNPDLIPKPVLEPLPTAKKPEETKPEPKKPAETKSPEKKPEDKKPADAKPEEKKPAEKSEEKKPADKAAPEKSSTDKNGNKSSLARHSEELLALADTPPAAKVDEKKPDEKKTDDQKPQDSKTGDKKPDEKKPAEKKPDATKPGTTATEGKKPAEKAAEPAKSPEQPTSDIKRAEAEQALEAERKRIETENRSKQDQYDQTVKQGKDRAKELNARFTDWFYLIAEDDYKKLHVSRDQIIKKKPGAEPSLGPVPQDPFKVPKPPLGIPGQGG